MRAWVGVGGCKVQPDESEVPSLRAALAACPPQLPCHGSHPGPGPGAPRHLNPSSSRDPSSEDGGATCGRVAFDLATALLGMGWDDGAQQQGAALYQSLAARCEERPWAVCALIINWNRLMNERGARGAVVAREATPITATAFVLCLSLSRNSFTSLDFSTYCLTHLVSLCAAAIGTAWWGLGSASPRAAGSRKTKPARRRGFSKRGPTTPRYKDAFFSVPCANPTRALTRYTHTFNSDPAN